jgi:hypothetical protein
MESDTRPVANGMPYTGPTRAYWLISVGERLASVAQITQAKDCRLDEAIDHLDSLNADKLGMRWVPWKEADRVN